MQKYPQHIKHETPRNTPSNIPWNTQKKYELRIFWGYFSGVFGVFFRSPAVGGILYVGLVFRPMLGSVCVWGVFSSVAGSWVVKATLFMLSQTTLFCCVFWPVEACSAQDIKEHPKL